MSLPKIAIVGRPNVGKSSLLNRLARRRVSIVAPTPGVTRDRVGVDIELEPPISAPKGTRSCRAELIDTGGFGVYAAEGKRFDDAGADLATLTDDIEAQIAAAIEHAEIVLLICDAQSGVTSLDEQFVALLRRRGWAGKVLPVANKVDGPSWVPHAMEMAALGFGEPMCVSTTSGHGVRELLDALYERVAKSSGHGEESSPVLKLAIVGKRNAGKSSLINALAGEPRVIVSEIAGTTRDSVDVRFDFEGKRLIAIDTAGVRKRKSVSDRVEVYAYDRMIESIERADVVLLLVEATAPISMVEKKLSSVLQEQFKPTVIVVTKTDLLDKNAIAPNDFLDYLTQQLRGLDYAPIVFISSKTGEGLADLLHMAHNLFAQSSHRESTADLNEAFRRIMEMRGPSSRLGSQAKLYFASQVATNPPTIVCKVNKPELFEGQYARYLLNSLRDELAFSEVPIKLIFSPRDRMELAEMKDRGRRKSRT